MSKNARNARRADRSKRQGWLIAGLLIAGGLLLIGTVLFSSLQSDRNSNPDFMPEVSGQPSLEVDREVIDLGDVKLGQTVSATFTLTNVGDRPLRFSQAPVVQVAAGC